MTFDGKKYKLANPVQAAAYHPHTNMQAQVIGENLRNSYFSAQQNARFVGQVQFQSNYASPLLESNFMIKSVNLTKIAKINAYLSEGFTHLIASVSFGVSSHYPTSIFHRLVITNESAESLTGNTSKVSRPAGVSGYTFSDAYGNNAGIAAGYRQGQAICEVVLEQAAGAKITLNEQFTIEIQGNAKNSINWQDIFPGFTSTELSFAEPELYRPMFVSLWLEARAL